MHRKLPTLTLFLLFVFVFFGRAQSEVLGPNITFNVNSGEIYSQNRPFDQWYPASITKLMTTYVTFREIKSGRISLQSPVRISPYALSTPPSKMGFPVGTILTVESALKILMVKSANDIAVAVAESVGGSESQFAQMMNRYSKEIGMRSSNWVNPHGLHNASQYTTAYDMGVLARRIQQEFPQYAGLFSIQAIKVGNRVLRNHNALMRKFPGTTGMKTGFICAGGLNIVASAKLRGRHIVSVVLGGTSGRSRNILAAELLKAASLKNGWKKVGNIKRPNQIGPVMPPRDISEQVCRRKTADKQSASNEGADEDAKAGGEGVENAADLLKQKEEYYFLKQEAAIVPILVSLGNATGPDPFKLLEPKPVLMLSEEANALPIAGTQSPDTQERFGIIKGQVIPIPTARPVTP